VTRVLTQDALDADTVMTMGD